MQNGLIAGSPPSDDLIRSQIIWILRDLVYEWLSGGCGILERIPFCIQGYCYQLPAPENLPSRAKTL
jgi:hypothetical protein